MTLSWLNLMDSFYRWKHGGSEKSCELPKVTGARLNPGLDVYIKWYFILYLLSMWQAYIYLRCLMQPSSLSRWVVSPTEPWPIEWHWGSGRCNHPGSWWQSRLSCGLSDSKGCAYSTAHPASPGDDASWLGERDRRLLDPHEAGALWLSAEALSGLGTTEANSFYL